MNADTPSYKSKAERWRTIAAVVQVALGTATLFLLIFVNFL
jgi:hypothetical protein